MTPAVAIFSVCLTVKPVGEPDAGNPHVRFDERRRETASWCGLRHRRSAKAAGPATPRACHDRARLRLYTDEQRREAGCIAGRMPPYLWKSALRDTRYYPGLSPGVPQSVRSPRAESRAVHAVAPLHGLLPVVSRERRRGERIPRLLAALIAPVIQVRLACRAAAIHQPE